MAVVEQYARAQIIEDEAYPSAVPAALGYDPDDDPDTVRVRLSGSREWTFPRDLLERGLRTPAESGGVRVWPCGRVQVVVEFHDEEEGVTVVQFESRALLAFLGRTWTAELVNS
ncbi:SsgA family sporulation/cell division regulator [Streptomyces sp. J2-1]|uniref:SsgA family sporulation/cell division regulator n=1 Tax=Streptomyces corallincola TaxID=2851888 RepID=UPI001C381174|nr:SsgA family sporulation/cell division regulator [Streptomyces corallincola]MBV2356911.1 SsgA family sporulation/cell division regulator [Streptomyces corallincola]